MRSFNCGEKSCYTNEKLQGRKLVMKQYEVEVMSKEGQTKYDHKQKKHVPIKPTTGFLAKAVRHSYSNLTNVSHNDPAFERALKLASRAFSDLEYL